MTERTGLGPFEIAVLTAVEKIGGSPDRGYRRTLRVLQCLEDEHGLGSRYSYSIMQDLAVPWRLHLPLLDARGNFGSQHGDPAADARYTEIRLSRVGALALRAERAEVGPVPLGLIEGSLYRDGPVPPFAPSRVLAALTDGSADAGTPALPTGGEVSGPVHALLAGRRARLTLACTVVVEPGQLVITAVPLGVRINDVTQYLMERVMQGHRDRSRRRSGDYLGEAHVAPDERTVDGIPVADLRDETTVWTGVRVVCILVRGADPGEAIDWLRTVWPVAVEVDCRLPTPMRRRLADWDAGDGAGLTALATAIDH